MAVSWVRKPTSTMFCYKFVTSILRCLPSGVKASAPILSGASQSNIRPQFARNKVDVSGIFPPIVTCFNAKEEIDWDSIKRNISQWNDIPFRGYVVQGSNGEYAYMDSAERLQLVQRLKQWIPQDKLLLAGSGCESTRATIEMTNSMADSGADAALVVTPCFYKSGMTDAAMLAHYTRVADEAKVPVILYNVPPNTGIELSAEVIVKLSFHPNIIGLKDSGGDISKLALVVHKTKANGFQVLAGSAGFLYAAYQVGCVGGVCALANVLGNELCQLESLFRSQRYDKALALQQRLITPNADVTRRFGVAGLKQAMEWFGYIGGPTRSPLQPLTSAQRDTLRKDFEDSGFLQ